MKKLMIATFASLFSLALIAGETHFLRIEINETKEEGSHVNVRLPLNLINAFEETVRDAIEEVDFEGHEINVRQIWETLKEAGPTDFIEINDAKGSVRVSTTGSQILISADGEYRDKVSMTIPYELCDAKKKKKENLDFNRIVAILESMAGRDLVMVNSEDATVRIWIE